MASVTPVVDGFVLRKGAYTFLRPSFTLTCVYTVGLAHSSLPKLVHAHARHLLTTPTQTRRGIDLSPHQLIANKTVCETPPLKLLQ